MVSIDPVKQKRSSLIHLFLSVLIINIFLSDYYLLGKKLKIILVLLFFILTSCSTHVVQKVRTDYQLQKIDGFIISNSQTSPFKFVKDEDVVKVKFNIIIRNVADKIRNLNTKSSFAKINEEIRQIKCLSHQNKKEVFSLESGEYVTINCSFDLSPTPKNRLRNSDVNIKSAIALNSKTSVNFIYRVFIEDFE